MLLNAIHDEFLNAFKSLPAESQRLLNDRYEVQIRNEIDDAGDMLVRVNSINSEEGWKEIGPRQKVSTTRTVHSHFSYTEEFSNRLLNHRLHEYLQEICDRYCENQAIKILSLWSHIDLYNSIFKILISDLLLMR